jgi:hypothetical protein
MSLLTEASLIVTPNGYNVGKLYSVVPNTTLGDMDVSRALSATRVNEQKFIEIARTNYFRYSQDISLWHTPAENVTLTSNTTDTISPDGTNNASKITIGSSGTIKRSFQITNSVAGVGTFSGYVKAETSNQITLLTTSGSINILYNLSTLAITETNGTGTITSVGGGWYRITATNTLIASEVLQVQYTNTAGQTIYIWGFQVEVGSTATDYIPTIASIRTKFAGITQDGVFGANIPRLDYTNSTCPSILVEPARTNLVLYSEEFDNAYWGKTNTTVTANATTAPDGTSTADKLTITTTSGTHQINRLSVVASSQCAMSIYAKADGVNTLTILDGGTANNGSIFNLSTVNVTNIGTGVGTIVSVGDGWYRCITIVTTTGFRLYCPNSSTSAGDGTSGIYIWGAQLEAGSNATSYIPTTTATVTRNADVISKTGISSLIGQTEGTLFFESKGFSDGNTAFQFITLNDGTTDNQIGFNYTTGGIINGYVRVNLGTQNISSTVSKTLNSKIILKYNSSNVYTFFINGSLIGSATAASSFSSPLTTFKASQGNDAGNYNGNIKMISIWKTALDNDQCILLTGPSFSTYPEMANALIYTIQ